MRILKWIGISLGALVVLVILLAIFAPAPDEEETDAPVAEQTTEEETEAPEPEPEDTGRMSEGEYDTFVSVDDELIREGEQWSGELQACTRIGQTGDLAGFRDCVEEAWDGFEGAALVAHGNADDTLDDVGKKCLRALRRYRGAVNRMYAVNETAHQVARSLDLSLFRAAFRPLPRTAKRYTAASRQVRDVCEPR